MYVKSLNHAFNVLELLSQEPHGIRMTEIGRKLDLNKSTIYRLLAEMKSRGYIYQEGERGVYKIGIKFIELCGAYLNNVELKTEAHPFLRQLNGQLDQTVYLAILQDAEVVYIDKIEKYNSFRKYSIIGQRKPVYNTSLGKSLLMSITDNEIRELLKEVPMLRFTANTITDIESFIHEIHLSRIRGWAYDNEEAEEGVRCMSAPVFDYRLKVIAAISTSWFIDSCSNLNEEHASRLIVQTADAVSKRMGCTADIKTLLMSAVPSSVLSAI
jgi:DNA-binding IclR family transcriptional regulator